MFPDHGDGGGREGISLAELRDLVGRHLRLLVLGCVAGALLAVGVVGLRAPVYRTTATLLLDQNRSAGGLLGDLAAITAAPVATSEMEILSSRTVAEAVVARPEAAAGDEDARETALGLTTLVEDPGLSPLAAWRRRLLGGGAKGHASLEAAVEPTAPRDEELELLVEFLASDRVRVSERTPLSRVGAGGADALELPYRPGAALEYGDLRLRLAADGPVAGRTFVVRWLPFEDAVERVMESTGVSETQRNSGVIELVYEDSDPERAAATANALCRNYLRRNLRRSEKRASQTVDFIRDQLAEQIDKLSAAEKEVVELQGDKPHAVDVGETAKSLIQELSSIELERVQLRLARTSLAEAVELIEQGEFDALSRIGPELADPISQSYIERIAQLTSEADLLERRDAGAYKALVQGKLLELQAARDALELRLKTLRKIAEDLAEGRGEALGGLASTAESGRSDPLLSAYVERWTAVDARLRELEQEFTDALPEIGELRGERAQAEARILELVRGRIEGYEEQAEEYGRLVAGYEERLDGYPAAERETIDRALSGLRERTLTHLRSRLAGLRGREDQLAGELSTVEGRLARLPEEERELADPMRRMESHSEIVKFLLGRQKEAEITRAATVPSAEFIDTAVPPACAARLRCRCTSSWACSSAPAWRWASPSCARRSTRASSPPPSSSRHRVCRSSAPCRTSRAAARACAARATATSPCATTRRARSPRRTARCAPT